MPASLFHDSEPLAAHHHPSSMSAAAAAAVAAAAVANGHNGHHHQHSNTLEDQRALQLALELSMLGLINEGEDVSGSVSSLAGGSGGCQTNACYADLDARARKSQNTTECVPVPSSEHVAEIVGRQGCKIKALRAKTNTYIKTPVRGEEPVFVVTGRKEDVNAAKREILSAAEHFSQIRAQRKSNLSGLLGGGGGLGPNANLPGQTTIQVRVPYRVVGLVVGPKGATIKRIQQQTNTYIITPSRDKEPIFEVTGLPESVEAARKEIEAHIAIRTGGIIDSTAGCGNGSSTGSDSGSRDCLVDSPVLLMYDQHHAFRSAQGNNHLHNGHQNGSSSSATAAAFLNGAPNHNGFSSLYANNNATNRSSHQTQDPFSMMFAAARDSTEQLLSSPGSRLTSSTGASSSSTALNCAGRLASDIYSSAFSSFGSSSSGSGYERDEGLGDSPTFESAMSAAAAVTAASGIMNGNSGSSWPDFGTRNPRLHNTSSSMASSASSSSSSSSVNGIAQRPFPSSSTSSSGIGSQSQSP